MSVVRERFDSGKTGPTIDAGSRPVAVVSRFRVPKVLKAAFTDRSIGRDSSASAVTAFRLDDFERLERRLRGMLAVYCNCCDTCKRWRVVPDIGQEGVDSVGAPFSPDPDSGVSKVSDISTESVLDRQSVNERSEPNALDDAVHPDRRPLHVEIVRGHIFITLLVVVC